MFAHFEDASADSLDITQIALSRLAQASQQTTMGQTILQAKKPGIEFVGALDREHDWIVFE